MSLALLLGGVSLVSGIIKGINARKQQKEAEAMNPVYTPYQPSQYAQNNLGMAQTMLNARNPGMQRAYAGVQANNANTLAYASRNSTNSGQNLALAASADAQANDATLGLAEQDAAMSVNRQGQLMQANQGMVEEDNKVYQDKMQKYMLDRRQKEMLLNASMQNKEAMFNDFGKGAFGVAGYMQQQKYLEQLAQINK